MKEVPLGEEWRTGLLDKLLALRMEKQSAGEDVRRVTALLASLCST